MITLFNFAAAHHKPYVCSKSVHEGVRGKYIKIFDNMAYGWPLIHTLYNMKLVWVRYW